MPVILKRQLGHRDAETQRPTWQDDALLYKLPVLYDLGRYRELLELASPLLADPSSPATIFYCAAEAAVQQEQFAMAGKILRTGLAAHPQSCALLGTQIGLLNRLGLYREALIAASRALELEPDHADIWYLQAVVQFNMRNFNAAEQSIVHARSLEPAAIDKLAVHARILWVLDMDDQAWEMTKQGLAQEPDNEDLLLLHAQMAKKESKSIGALQRLLRINPTNQLVQSEYRELTSQFKLNCLIAALLTLAHGLFRYLVAAGQLSHLPKTVAEDGVMFALGVAALFLVREHRRYKLLIYLFVVFNLELSWLESNLRVDWRLGLAIGIVTSLLIGLLFTWGLFFYRAMLAWGIRRSIEQAVEMKTARSSGFLAAWLQEQVQNKRIWLAIGGGLLLGGIAAVDLSGELYPNVVLSWLGLLLVLLPLLMNAPFSAAFAVAFVCLLAFIPVVNLLRWLPAVLPLPPLLALIAFAGGCLATAYALQVLVADDGE